MREWIAQKAAVVIARVRNAWLAMWQFPKLFEALLAVFTLMLVVVAVRQTSILRATDKALHEAAEAAKTSADTARKALVADVAGQRAWVAPMQITPNEPLDNAQSPTFKIAYQNVGREPAQGSSNRTYTASSEVPVGVGVDWNTLATWKASELKPEEMCKGVDAVEGGSIVYPSQFPVYAISSPAISKPLMDDVRSQKVFLLVFGCLAYRSLGEPRHSTFCWFLMPDASKPITQWEFHACPVGNRAD